MSTEESSSILCGAYASLPILTEDNFADWELQVIAYLTGSADHAGVITPTRQSDGTFLDPVRPAPADAAASPDEKKQGMNEITAWVKSKCIVIGRYWVPDGHRG